MIQDAAILQYLQEHRACGASEIARVVGLSCSATVQKLQEMESKGKVRRAGFYRKDKITKWALAAKDI